MYYAIFYAKIESSASQAYNATSPLNKKKCVSSPKAMLSETELRPLGEQSGDLISAVRTDERAATAAALCDP